MSRITGIDLGTTNSAAAILNELGKPDIVPNAAEGFRLTPSSLLFSGNDIVKVGKPAKDNAGFLLDHEVHHYVKEIKRKMPDLSYRRDIRGRSYSPTELSSLILKKTISGIQEHRGGVGPVAISVPAYFVEAERKATLKAGELAGLDVVGLVNEPTAAAIAYSVDQQLDGKYLIFDLGGGTFDVTILEGEGKEIEVLTTTGDKELGGANFDCELFTIFANEYMSRTNQNLCLGENGNSKSHKYHWFETAQAIKHLLSTDTVKNVTLYNKAGGGTHSVPIHRERFVDAISSYLLHAEKLVEKALQKANLAHEDITEVLLVGGSTRIPAVQALLQRLFNRPPTKNINPDEAVAMGAAIYAGCTTLKKRPKYSMPASIKYALASHTISDVINSSYGTIARDRITKELYNAIMIKKDTKLPATYEQIFSTGADDQVKVNCQITQGDETDPEFLPPFLYEEILELPHGRPSGQLVRVKYTCDENHILHVYFEDIESGNFVEKRLVLAHFAEDSTGDSHPGFDNLKIE